ncbi:MAG: lysylphosphatidylglycerol synthase domain-containing protein [Caulobacteraceae bacterium]
MTSRTRSRLRLWAMVAMVLGVALATAVAGWVGFGRVFGALERIGWQGLATLVIWSVLPWGLLGFAWFLLLPGQPMRDLRIFVAARVIRDSVGELLPFTQIGGFAAGARAVVLQGLSSETASSTTVVDVTNELIAQLGFTAIGLTMLASRLGAEAPHSPVIEAGVVGLILTSAATAFFIVFQKSGMPILARLTRRIAPSAAADVGDFSSAVNALYEPPLRLAAAAFIHLCAWIASAAGAWAALAVAGWPISLGRMLAIEALICAVRSAAFFTPMAAGIQEATYAVIGPLFGLPADMAVAVSLMKRAKDFIVGLPALAVWQTFEGRRLIRAGRSERATSSQA